jgi:hypothetical protein
MRARDAKQRPKEAGIENKEGNLSDQPNAGVGVPLS